MAQTVPIVTPEPWAPTVSAVVVTAPLASRSVHGANGPNLSLDEHDIQTYGADTIDELLEAISPLTRGAGSDAGPVVLVNGRPVPNLGGLGGVPPEALQRVEILPEGPSLSYGQRPGQRVVNLVLREKYAAITAEASYGETTDGGHPSSGVNANVVRIHDSGRWSLDAAYHHEGALLDSQRGLAEDDASSRTLLPRLDEWTLGGGYNRTFSDGVELTGTAAFTTSQLHGLLGLAAPGEVIGNTTGLQTANLGLTFDGQMMKDWQWSVTAAFDSNDVHNEITTPTRPITSERADTDTRTAALEALFTGSAFKLPAGPVGVSVKLRLDDSRIDSRAASTQMRTAARLARQSGSAQANLDFPITSRGGHFLSALGDLTLSANARVDELSDFGRLNALGGGLTWAPSTRLAVFGQVTRDEIAPSLQQLGAPLFVTPGVETFDYLRNETVVVERIDGGNPALRPVRQRQVRFGVTFQPAKSVHLSSTYSDRSDEDPIVTFPVPTAAIQQAFPARFTRGPDGQLTQMDQRPINVDSADTRNLVTTVDVRLPWPGTNARGDRIDVSLTHTWWLRDRLTIGPGVPVLDFLSGSVGESGTARPTHQLSLQAGGSHAGFGAHISATWQSATQVDRPTGGPLSFSALAVANLKLFVDLDKVAHGDATPAWLKDLRLTLDVNNVFDSRQRVRDAQGATPFAYAPPFLDPVGREILVSLRKQF